MHVLIPAEPVIEKVIVPAGATALREPVTVAVNVTAPPSVNVDAEEVIAIVGAAKETVVDVEELEVETEL